jgi:xanthine/CO dehydrogenase XdhC/CoxF family maturation factor
MLDSRTLVTVLDNLLRLCGDDGAAALATIVRTSGSTYRKAGARLTVALDGRTFGEISAGCLEADVAEVATEAHSDGAPRLLHYDNGAREDILWGLGLGCNGKVDVLVEPVKEGDALARFYGQVARALRDEEAGVLATVCEVANGLGTKVGDHLFIGVGGRSLGDLANEELVGRIGADAAVLLRGASSGRAGARKRHYELARGSAVEVSLETVTPPIPLVVVGADPDAVPIVRLAAAAGFRVTVVDHRPTHATRERFPEAETVICCRAAELAANLTLTAQTFVIVKTHNFLADQETLAVVLPSPVKYIGQMGPRSRAEELFLALAKDGHTISEEQMSRFYGPIGLDVSPESAEEIAVSIVAELLAVRAGREGGFLRELEDRIHPTHAPER